MTNASKRFFLLLVILDLTLAFTAKSQIAEDSVSVDGSNQHTLETIEVKAKKPLITTSDGKIIMNISGSTLASGSTALEILARAPGVTLDNEGNASLRGKPGVSIMINNKLTHLSGAQLASLLRATKGSTIQTIEIISNPSARYDASGTGGIINIILKKNESFGTNGTANLSGGYGNYYKSDAGIDLNHRNKYFNIFGSYNYTKDKASENLTVNRSTAADGLNTFFRQQNGQVYHRDNNNFKAGLDYDLNKKNVLGVMLSGYLNRNNVNDRSKTLIGSTPSGIDSSVIAQNPGRSSYRNLTTNLNYKSIIDTLGKEFSADLDYSTVKNLETTTYNNQFYNSVGTEYKSHRIFRNAAPNNIHILSLKAGYLSPIGPTVKLETGIKSSLVNTNNEFKAEAFNEVGDWNTDFAQSNSFKYKELVNAAYANLHKDYPSMSVQIGLRAELTHSEGNSMSAESVVRRTYLDIFPSAVITHKLGDNHELSLFYSKRIDRPDYAALNPFVYFADLYTFSKGNSMLKPQYANSIDLSYLYKKNTRMTFGYIHTRDVITTTLITDTVNKTLLLFDQNLASRSTISININKPLSIAKWWTTNNDLTVYYSRFSSPNLMGLPFENQKSTLIFSSVHSFTFTSSLSGELNASYTSSQAYGTYIAKPIYGIDLGIKKSFAGNRAHIKLGANDVLNQRKISILSAVPSQDYRLSQKEESRIYRLSFTYNFGSSLIKAVRERSNSSKAEQSRLKSGN